MLAAPAGSRARLRRRRPPLRAVVLAGALALLAAVPGAAAAADLCVATSRPGCAERPTAATALDAARPGDRVLVGPGDQAGPLTVPRGVLLLGAGPATRVAVASGPALTVAGRAEALTVDGDVRARPGDDSGDDDGPPATLARLTVAGSVTATGPTVLDATAVRAPATAPAALVATCAEVLGRGLTLTGGAPHAIRADCASPRRVALSSTVLTGPDPVATSGAADVDTAFSAHAPDPDVAATATVDPSGLGDEPRPGPGSPLTDAGDPAPLAAPDAATMRPGEPFGDRGGAARMADGDGDGTVRRDIGADEYQPPAPPDVAGNVLVNPGAELSGLIDAGVPAGWTGGFGVAAYGADDLPSAETGAALGAGAQLFAGATAVPAELLQRIDLGGAGPAIDAGTATAALSGLLGGYGADADSLTVTAAFRDPEGHALGELALASPTAGERGNDTTLLARSASGAIPPRTRAIDVTVRGTRAAGGYTDAYADRLALVLSVPGAAVGGTVTPQTPINPDLRPFAGVSVLTAGPRFGRAGRASVLVACATGTVGRCRGRLELRASLAPSGRAPGRIGRYAPFSIAPGRVRRVSVRLLSASRRALARRHRLKARFVAVAADGQGLQRRRVVPVRLRLPGARRAARHG